MNRSAPHSPQTLVIVISAIALFLVITWANYHYLTGPHRYDDRDFVSLWAGGKAVAAGLNPYDPEVWGPWRVTLGNTWVPDDRAPFPLWTLLFFIPFSLFDLGWGAALWVAASIFMLAGALFLLGKAFDPKKLSLPEFFLFALGAAVYRGGLLTLFVGQLTYALLLIVVLYVVLAHRKRPFAAGMVLAFIAFKPNPFILFAPLLGIWLIARQKWSTIYGGIVGALFLLVISWLVIPGWLFQWLNVTGKTEVTFITPTIWGLAYELTPTWWLVTGLVLLVGITAVSGWFLVINTQLAAFEAVSLALAASILTTPYAWEYEHLLLLIPWTFIFFTLRGKNSWIALALWTLGVLILPWWMYRIAIFRQLVTFTAVVPLLTFILTFLTIIYSQKGSREVQTTTPTPG